jgi:hypothetical protein
MRDIDCVDIIAELAKESSNEYPIDFADLSISESDAFKLMASEIYEKFNATKGTDNERLILLSAITTLTVENFVLNLRLLKQHRG